MTPALVGYRTMIQVRSANIILFVYLPDENRPYRYINDVKSSQNERPYYRKRPPDPGFYFREEIVTLILARARFW